jgi:hypothetical protein
MPLKPLHFPLLKQVIPPAFLREQASISYQLTHPDGRNPEDLSGLFGSEQSHHMQSCTTCCQINQPFSVHETSFNGDSPGGVSASGLNTGKLDCIILLHQ